MNLRMQWVIARLLDVAKEGFYGQFVIKLESGQPVRIEHTQSEKPPEEAR